MEFIGEVVAATGKELKDHAPLDGLVVRRLQLQAATGKELKAAPPPSQPMRFNDSAATGKELKGDCSF
jgi:hypothetical protein